MSSVSSVLRGARQSLGQPEESKQEPVAAFGAAIMPMEHNDDTTRPSIESSRAEACAASTESQRKSSYTK